MDDINDVKVYDENLQGDENDENRRRLDRVDNQVMYICIISDITSDIVGLGSLCR